MYSEAAVDTEGEAAIASLALPPRQPVRPAQRKGYRAKAEIDVLATVTSEPRMFRGDARHLPFAADSVDLIVTSPPYFQKRDYTVDGQIGLETTPAGYVAELVACLAEWRRVLRPHGSIFLNVGDTFYKKSLANVPGRIELAAADDGWMIRNRIIWTKDRGMPEPAQNRLAMRHEYIIHLTQDERYYYDLFGYSEAYGNGANPGDVWAINPERNMGKHLAPFPRELVARAIQAACPDRVCAVCGQPRTRVIERTAELDPARPQAKRAMELARQAGLTSAHFAAIRATGVSDAGKAMRQQTGTGKNSAEVQRLAKEAKDALGGYFREFTFGKQRTVRWNACNHKALRPAVVLDPFAGTGTTLRVACQMGRTGIGVDLDPHTA